MENVNLTALERRKIIQQNALNMGINDEFISKLVDTFYDHVRKHDRLGPIFDDIIGDNWTPHLLKMKSFWSSVAMNSGTYSGQPVPVHRKLTNVREADFDIWLSLFEKTLIEIAPTEEVIPYFMERAARIAQSLQLSMFGVPELRQGRL
ncbi:MAG: group III truncated hemoglobin [Alphaproteobacteria bacterium]|nr:group III truncated hemoglobin [Alphaproteobacteria bacterium]HRW30241.1 group III truncated hemoglobin [Emcibacteraceae bacterium]